MNRLTYGQVREMLLACADRIIRNEPYLTKVDSAIGDGDHGNGMLTGMKAAEKVLEDGQDGTNIFGLYADMAEAMQRAMGGASGMIFSTLFAGDAKDRAPASEITPAVFADQMAAGLRAIKELGHAEPGDKTMVDAMEPAVQAMKEHADGTFEEMLSAAADAARLGMERTKEQVAKFGRAKNLGSRALGHQDAGATSTWLILLQMADYVNGTESQDPDIALLDAGAEKVRGFVSKKIINDPADVVKEEGEGFLYAFGDEFEAVPGVNGFIKKNIPDGKTALVIGGGSGHEPIFGFFLGENLADASANGNVFASPDPVTVQTVAEAAHRGAGVLFVYGNYAGDNLNFDKAVERLEAKGIKTRTVRVRDDVVSAPKERYDDRRGIAGDYFVLKVAGAACASLPLEEAARVTEKAAKNTFTVGVGLQGASLPGKTEPIFTLPADKMEYGLGIHGEPGIRQIALESADSIVDNLVDVILADSGIKEGDTVCTYVNGLGSTTLMELMIMNRRLAILMKEKKIRVHDMQVDRLVTTMEMAGASISLMKLDDELAKYYDMPCASPYFTKKGK